MYSTLILMTLVDYFTNNRTDSIYNVIPEHIISSIEIQHMDICVLTSSNQNDVILKRRNINLMYAQNLGQIVVYIVFNLQHKPMLVIVQVLRTFFGYDKAKLFHCDVPLSQNVYKKPIQSRNTNKHMAKRSTNNFFCLYYVVSNYINIYVKLFKSLLQQQYIKTCACAEITDDQIMQLEDKEAARQDDGERVVKAAEEIEGGKERHEETAEEMIKRNAELKSANLVIAKQEPLTFKQKVNSMWQIARGNDKRKPISDIADEMIKEEAAKGKSKKGKKAEAKKPTPAEIEKPAEKEEKPAAAEEEEEEKPAEEKEANPAKGGQEQKPAAEEGEEAANPAEEGEEEEEEQKPAAEEGQEEAKPAAEEETQTPEKAENPATPAAA